VGVHGSRSGYRGALLCSAQGYVCWVLRSLHRHLYMALSLFTFLFSSFPPRPALSLSILSFFSAHSYPLPSPGASPSALRRHASTADSRRTLTRIAFAVTRAKAASDPSGLSPSTLDADEQPSNPFDPFDLSIAQYPPTGQSFSAYFSRIRILTSHRSAAYLQSACPRQPHNGSHQRRSPILILLRLAP
jgi:hypothetical protein